MLRQETVRINGVKVIVRSRPKLHMGNLCGWLVWINGQKYFKNVLTRGEAVKLSYTSWIKSNSW